MNIAIVGSVCLKDSAVARRLVTRLVAWHKRYTPYPVIISGGAEGVDTIAAEAAKEQGVRVVIFASEGKGWTYYKKRNMQIARTCDELIRVRGACSATNGSGWTLDRAAALGKPTVTYVVANEGTVTLNGRILLV